MRNLLIAPASIAAIALAIGVSGCADTAPVSDPESLPDLANPENKTVDTNNTASGQPVTGQVPVSADGSLSVVMLQPHIDMALAPTTEPVRMDQLGMEFLPPVLLAELGQPVHFRNSEDVLHNVRVYNIDTLDTAFNISTPLGGTYEYRFEVPGTYRVACDIHPAMGASVVVTSVPYATVATRDGDFSLDNVVPGAYTAIVQAGSNRFEHDVNIEPNPTELILNNVK